MRAWLRSLAMGLATLAGLAGWSAPAAWAADALPPGMRAATAPVPPTIPKPAPEPAAGLSAGATAGQPPRPSEPLEPLRAAPAPVGRFEGTGCPFIRPPGLNREQIHQLVLVRLATALQRPVADIDPQRSFAELVSGPDALNRYRFAALAIGESLGFDAPTRFAEAAQRRGSGGPHRVLTLRHLQAVALNAYQEGVDALPPEADASARYRLDGVLAQAPQAGEGRPWRLMHCGHDQVAYWRPGLVDGSSATAVVRLTALPRWRSPEAFADHLRDILSRTVPEGYRVQQMQVQPTGAANPYCAEASLVARDGDHPYRMQARFCYLGPKALHGPTVMYSESGSDDVAGFGRAARDFVGRNLP